MLNTENYIREGLKTVELFLKNGQYRKALQGATELLRFDPNNKKARRLSVKIEKLIRKSNEAYVKAKINESDELWNSNEYEKLLTIYEQLLAYAPENKYLLSLISRAEEELEESKTNERKTFILQAEKAIESLYKNNQFVDAIRATDELLAIDPRNKAARSLKERSMRDLIDVEIKQNSDIVDSNQYIEALKLYRDLLSIDPASERLHALIHDAEKNLREKEEVQQRITINRGVKNIRELFDAKDYEKAKQACEETLRISPNNFIATLYLGKVKKIIDEETERTVIKKMQEADVSSKEEARRIPDLYIRL